MNHPSIQFGNPESLYDPAPNGYSHVAVVAPGSSLIFIAGQGGELVNGSMSDDFATQVAQALDNVQAALAWSGASMKDVVKLTVLIADYDEEKGHIFIRELQPRFGDRMQPTCTLIPVPRLALSSMMVEVEAVAARPAI